MNTVNTSQQIKFFFNDAAVEYGVAWLLARAGLEASDGNTKPVPVTDTILAIAMFFLGKITTGQGGSREISLRATERITRWNYRTIAKALKLLEAAELVTKLPDTNVYSSGPAVIDGRLQNEIDHFNSCIGRREKPEWPINNDKRRGPRRRAKQQPATIPTPQVVQSEYTTPITQVLQSEYSTQVLQSEYSTPLQSEYSTLRGIETKPSETSLNPETEIPAGSDLAKLLEGEASTAERSPRSHGPAARAHLERSQPPSASPEQPDLQHQSVDDLIRQAAAGKRKPAQPAQADALELSTDYQLAVDEAGFTLLLNPKPGMLLLDESTSKNATIESVEDGLAWIRLSDGFTDAVPVDADGQLPLSGSRFRPLTQQEESCYSVGTHNTVEIHEQ